MKLFNYLGRKRLAKKRLGTTNMLIEAGYEESQTGKGGDIWGTDWPVPVAEKFEWHFYDDTATGKQYITMQLTDYIFFFIPFTYDQYIYEIPGGTYAKHELTTKTVAGLIYFLEHWNWHTDQVYYVDDIGNVEIKATTDITYKLGNNDYSFIRTKE